MMRRPVLLVLLLLAAACAPAAPPTPTATLAPTATFTPAPTSTPQPTPTTPGVAASACMLQDFTGREVSVGFPRLEERLPTTGVVRAAVLFADFADAEATFPPEELLSWIDPDAAEFYRASSYGKLQFELMPHLTWLRMPGSALDYNTTSFDGEREVLQLAADLADAEFDFSAVDMIIVITDPTNSPFEIGPAFTGGIQPYGVGGIDVDEVTINNGTVSGRDLYFWGYPWLNHETGHLMGLADLYLYGETDYLRYVSDWGMMGQINGLGHEFFAWERWQLGWAADWQVACLPSGGTATLTAVEVEGGVKMAVVPLSESRAVVVESRRAIGYDSLLPEGGALVYTIDSATLSGYGPLHVQLEGTDLMSAPLAAGESLTVDGVTITVLSSDELTDTVQLSLQE